MERTTLSEKFPIGSMIPAFSLPATDRSEYGDKYLQGTAASLVVFSCNHCPYVKGSDGYLIEIASEFGDRGLKTLVINSNDSRQYPDDSFEKMQEKSQSLKLPYPYLIDEAQAVAKLFDAQCTPESYLFNRDGKLVYHGKIVENPKDAANPGVKHLKQAVEQVLDVGECTPSYQHPIGCSIKWR